MPVPSTPVLTTVPYFARIQFTWGSAAGATAYRLRRKIQGDSDSNLALIYDGDALEYVDYAIYRDYTSSSNSLRSWTWDLVAYNDDGESASDTGSWTMADVTDTNIQSVEILHPSYNDGSDQTASYSDTTKSGSGGASDPYANETLIYYDQRWTASI